MTPEEQRFRVELVSLLPRLRRFGRAITRHRDDADDLVQVAVERALLRRGQLQPGTNMLSWLFKIMNNAWIDEVRSRARLEKIFAPEESGEHVGISPIDDHFNALAVRRAIDR